MMIMPIIIFFFLLINLKDKYEKIYKHIIVKANQLLFPMLALKITESKYFLMFILIPNIKLFK